MKHNPVRSDLRDCVSREPKPGQRELVQISKRMFGRSTKTGNVLSEIESQGPGKRRTSVQMEPELTGNSSGRCTTEPEGHFVLESPAAKQGERDSRKALL